MSSNQKKQQQKKKDREKLVKVKVAKRRSLIREQRKADYSQYLSEKEAHEIVHGKPEPIINNPQLLAEREAKKSRQISDQLNKNLEILKALEAEHEAEQARRENMNETLESEGHKTMKEKLDALHEKALQLTNKAEEMAKAKEDFYIQQNKENNLENSSESAKVLE